LYNREYRGKIELAVFDTAGTFCDGACDLRSRWPQDDLRGCKAPVIPFYETLMKFGIECDWETIRKPMGIYKPEHLRLLLNEPSVMEQWVARYNAPWTESNYEEILAEFRKGMSRYIVDEDLARPIPGAAECLDKLRAAGIALGCDTGYFADDAAALNKLLKERFGIEFDACSNSEKVQGRPSPFMIYDCMDQICRNGHDPFPCEAVVKIDDTAAGINSGNNAGAWTIAVYASGSNTFDQLAAAEPDYLVPDISYVASVIFESIQPALRDGFRPGGGR